MDNTFPYPGIRVTADGKQRVPYSTESRLAEAGVLDPITPSTAIGEIFSQSFAEGTALRNEA